MMLPRASHPRITGREWIAVLAVLLLAFALRTIDLTRVPPGLHNDEVVSAKVTERVTHGDFQIFYPDDTGSEPLHYYFAAPFMSVFGSTVWALRLPAIVLSMIAMCVVWALARRLFGPLVALVALIGFAIVFWTVAFGRIVLGVVPMVPLVSLSAYLFWRAREGQRRRWLTLNILSGVALGLALLAYTAPRIIPVVYAVFGIYAAVIQRRDWRRWLGSVAIVIGVAVLVASPMFMFLAQNPQDDQLGFFDIDRPLRELRQGNLGPVIETSLQTLGMFAFVGDPLPYYDVPDRPVLEPFGALLLLTGLLVAAWRWRKPEYAFVVLWFFISLAPGMLSQPAPNYTRTLGAQTVLFIAIGLGAKAVLDRQRGPVVLGAFALIFAGNLAWTVHDYFTLWPSVDTVRFWHHSGLYAVANELQRDPDSSPVVVCLPDFLIDERDLWWNPAWRHMNFLLHRPDITVRYASCTDTSVLIDGAARYALPDVVDEAALRALPIATQYLASAVPERLTLPDRLGVILKIDRATTPLDHELALAAQNKVFFEGNTEAGPGPIDLGGKLVFLGYTLAQTGTDLAVTSYWRVTDQLPPQFSQFTHVLNAQGDIVAQADRLMVTSQSLRAGDVVVQIHRLTLPDTLGAGSYRIAIGLYTQPDGQRLPVRVDQQPHGDRLFLDATQVK